MMKMYKTGTTVLSLFIFLVAVAQTKNNLTVEEFEQLINKDSVQVLDVRTAGEYATGHIKNTLLANWNDTDEFNRRIGFIDKHKPVYVYCLAGGRSAAAAEKMRATGFEKVYELQGGIIAWKAANKSLEGATTPAKQMTEDEFNTAVNAFPTVLVDFGAAWCPPCKTMEPVLQNLQTNHAGKFTLLKVDGGNDEMMLKKYKVSQLPVFIIFKNGKIVWRKDGVATATEIAAQL